MPDLFDDAWTSDSDLTARLWFLHLAGGHNLRTAPDLPFPLTRRMAHEVLSAAPHRGTAALRFGQFVGLGVPATLAHAVAHSRLASPAPDEPFWLTLGHFLVANPHFPPHEVGPLIDYLFAHRFPPRLGQAALQPNLTLRGRTARSLIRHVHDWHHSLRRVGLFGRIGSWASCGIPGFNRTEGAGPSARVFELVELLSGRELAEEGNDMRHCVASYAWRCAEGRCAIYSLRTTEKGALVRLATVEISLHTKEIVQARARCNAAPSTVAQRLIRLWAVSARIGMRCL